MLSKSTKLSWNTIFLGIIALMLVILVTYITLGLVVAQNMTMGEVVFIPAPSQHEDTTFVIEE